MPTKEWLVKFGPQPVASPDGPGFDFKNARYLMVDTHTSNEPTVERDLKNGTSRKDGSDVFYAEIEISTGDLDDDGKPEIIVNWGLQRGKWSGTEWIQIYSGARADLIGTFTRVQAGRAEHLDVEVGQRSVKLTSGGFTESWTFGGTHPIRQTHDGASGPLVEFAAPRS